MIDLTQLWQGLHPDWRNAIVRVGLAALVILVIWLLRRLLTAIVVAPLKRVAARTDATWDDELIEGISGPARFLIIALGLAIGAGILQVDVETNTFVQHLIRTFIIFALLLAGYRAVNIFAPSSTALFRLTGITLNDRLIPFIRTAAKLVLAALALVIIIQEWGYDVSGLVAGLGLGGLAFSLAAKDTVENLFGFTTVVGDQPFVVGEFIKTPDVEGTVEHVGIRSTRIRQLDQAYVTVPNSKLANAPVLNWSRLSKRWIDLKLIIGYDTTRAEITTFLERTRELLLSRPLIEPNSVFVRLVNFGENGMEVLVRAYVMQSDWVIFSAEKETIALDILGIVESLDLHLATRSVFLENPGRMRLNLDDEPIHRQEE